MTDSFDATERFGGRAELYAAYRPAYPEEMVAFLIDSFGLHPGDAVADLGSGTGILSEPFLDRGLRVFGVEPNGDMRAVAESRLKAHGEFHSVDGPAEATTLDTASVDLVVVGQAFHWFDPARVCVEIRRILQREGGCALIWNHRFTDATPFQRDYERFLRTWGTDYNSVQETYENMRDIESVLGAEPERRTFKNFQSLDREGLRGRVHSSSYMPAQGDPRSEEMLRALDAVFDRYQREGGVRIDYDTNVYWARILR